MASVVKVLMIGNSPSVKGGITTVISQLLSHNWEDYDVRMRFIPTYIAAGKLKKAAYFVFAYIRVLIALVLFRPDIVHIHMSYRGSFVRKFYIQKLCASFKVNTVFHLHGSEFEKYYRESGEKRQKQIVRLLENAGTVIVLGEKWKQFVTEIAPACKVEVLNNSIKIEEHRERVRHKPLTLLFLAVLIDRKGLRDLLCAVHELKSENKLSKESVSLLVAGTGEKEGEYRSYVEENDLNDIVDFLGWVDAEKKGELFERTDVMVLPSYNEGLPVAVLEAMSRGIPVISTNVGSIEEAVKDGKTGIIVSPGDIEGLKHGIVELLEDEALWRDFSMASYELVKDRFNEKHYFEKMLDIYYEQMRESEAGRAS